MEAVNLLSPIDENSTPPIYLRIPTIADIRGPTRGQNDPLGFEVELGSQQFVIPKRSEINTDWFMEWRQQTYKIIGIYPSERVARIVIYSRLIDLFATIINEMDTEILYSSAEDGLIICHSLGDSTILY